MSFLKEQVRVITKKMEDIELQLAHLTFMEDQWEHFMKEHWIPFQVALSSLHSPPCSECLYGVPALSPLPLSSSSSSQSEAAIPIPLLLGRPPSPYPYGVFCESPSSSTRGGNSHSSSESALLSSPSFEESYERGFAQREAEGYWAYDVASPSLQDQGLGTEGCISTLLDWFASRETLGSSQGDEDKSVGIVGGSSGQVGFNWGHLSL